MIRREIGIITGFYQQVPAYRLANDLGVDYQTITRVFQNLRLLLYHITELEGAKLSGEVEMDEAYFGGKRKGKRGRGAAWKSIVFGLLERDGRVYTRVVEGVSAETLMDVIRKKTRKGSVYYSDTFKSYNSLKRLGKHHTVNHSKSMVDKKTKNHIHGEQTEHFGGAKVAAKFNALSLDHGDYLDDEDISLLKNSGTSVVLLPGVLIHCMDWNKIDYPKLVQKLKTAGIPIAFATDYNPGSAPILSMKLVMDLGMRLFKMGMMECLLASTIIPAKVLAREKLLGSIEPSKQADILLVKAHSVADYLFQIGDRHFDYIIKKGQVL